MYKKFLIIVSFIVSFSCSNDKSNNSEVSKILQENKSLSLNSLGRKYRGDVLNGLYSEALESDLELNKIEEKFNEISELKKDSLRKFDYYFNNNYRYWSAVGDNVKYIKDSTLMKEIENDFEKFQKEYNELIKNHLERDSLLNKKSDLLRDYHTILKLKVTYNMIKKYQVNDLPKMDNHIYISNKYDSLIDATKNQIKKE